MAEQQDRPHASGGVSRGDTSQRVGMETIRERGGDPEEIREKLISALGAEMMTYYYYTNLRTHLAGHEDYKEIAEDARLEDRSHFELGAPRVYELGGKLPNDIAEFEQIASCPSPKLPDEPTAENILIELLEAERCAIRTWSEMCDMTEGCDRRTFDISQRILNEEIDHEAWFVELLSMERDGEVNPAGHFVRGDPGDAPYTQGENFNESA